MKSSTRASMQRSGLLWLVFAFALCLVSCDESQGLELETVAIYRTLNRNAGHVGQSARRLEGDEEDGDEHFTNRYHGYGVHYVDVYFGNPAVKMTLAVETASDFTAIPCMGCDDCQNTFVMEYYNIESSKNSSIVKCNQCYERARCMQGHRCVQDRMLRDYSAWEGYEVRDAVYHGGTSDQLSVIGSNASAVKGFELQFVCQTKTRGYFAQHVKNGVLGFSEAPSSFINQMYAAGKLKHPRFSLCFHDSVRNRGDRLHAGVVTFGGVQTNLLSGPMMYARQIPGDRWRYDYTVNITKLYLRVGGGDSIVTNIDQNVVVMPTPLGIDTSAVLDSSIPFLTFDERWEASFRMAWRQATNAEFSYQKRELTYDELNTMPTLLIELEGDELNKVYDPNSVASLTRDFNVLVAVPAIHYMERIGSGGGRPMFQPRIQFEGQKGSTLGANMMQRHVISYEIDRNIIGFAEAKNCEATTVVTGRVRQNRNVDGKTEEEEEQQEESTITSINTSGGSGGSTSRTGGDGTSSTVALAASVGDDLFAGHEEERESLVVNEDAFYGGGCDTATCRCFMAIGYVAIGTALAVAYRLSRPKDSKNDAISPQTIKPMIRVSDGGIGGDAYRRRPPTNADTDLGSAFV